MKKIVYLIAGVLATLGMASCEDANDLPDVNFNVAISGAQFVGNEIYVVQGSSINVDEVSVVNNEHGKGATIPYVNYYFDYRFIGQNAQAPYGFTIDIPDSVMIGSYSLEITAPVFATDKAPGYGIVTYKVNVVQSADDIPDNGVQNVITTAHVTDRDSNT